MAGFGGFAPLARSGSAVVCEASIAVAAHGARNRAIARRGGGGCDLTGLVGRDAALVREVPVAEPDAALQRLAHAVRAILAAAAAG